jgi:hypothetical protein
MVFSRVAAKPVLEVLHFKTRPEPLSVGENSLLIDCWHCRTTVMLATHGVTYTGIMLSRLEPELARYLIQ